MSELFFRLFKENQGNREFGRVLSAVRGWSSVNILSAISAALKASGGTYLEVGCMNGLSLCGAMTGNEDRLFVGVDNFSQFSGRRDVLMNNVNALYPDVDFHFYEMDYRAFFAEYAAEYARLIGTYFYDGDHAYEHQRKGLELGTGSGVLTDEAFMIVDDYSWEGPKRATSEFLRAHPDWRLILAEEDDWNRRGWWNGLAVLYRAKAK